jgi:branched-chain amino acid transport system permease protein
LAKTDRRKKRLDRRLKVLSDGLYALSSWREMTYLLFPRALLIVGVVIIPLFLDLYWQRVLCVAGIYALLALSFDFLAHFVGLVCLGGALFIGAGGYISGILNDTFGWSPFITIPLATLAGSAFCTLVFIPCLRLRGVYFAIVSFMYPLFAVSLIVGLNVFGGTEGISGLDNLPTMRLEQYVILGVVLVALFSLRRLVTEDIGLIFRGIKDNDQAVRAAGISIMAYRIKAMIIASLVGCFGGAYLTHLYGWVGVSLFALDFSVLPIAATVLGGMGSLVGPVLGAFILTPLSELLRGFGQLRVVLYCLILIGFIIYRPEGLFNLLRRKYEQFEYWEKV